jgi:predicted PurR-regulated permease PerM
VSSTDARTRDARSGLHTTSLAIIATVAAGAALYVAQEIFIPIALGLLLISLFRPLALGLARRGIPAPVTATLVVLGCLGVLAGAGASLIGPVRHWVSQAPETLSAARSKIEKLRRPLKQVSDAVEKAQQEVTGDTPAKGQGERPQAAAATSSGTGIPPVLGRVFATTAGLIGTLLQVIVIVFLVLATGDLFVKKLALLMPKQERGTPAETVQKAEAVVRRYLIVTALINVGQGIIVALTMWLIGVPSPLLWGLLTFVCEFLPYLGALFMVAALTVTGFATFDSIGQILLAPLAYIVISTIQNNAVSPFAYGSGLRLNPLAILLVVVVGWFLWGVAGAFVAVPLLAAVRIFAEHHRRDSRLAALLAE